ncbi:TetR/AcrR family transcriptional regulator [Haloarcula pellucida]|uniref:Transcriptional regulator n=1 Tax=Haloarcula pellucida TaxID=1427151 RepID=A0A830GL25_9EURY|nr:TetR/AcrR family transcriptional regulator [Halomicroarcula pellucida]MBX0348447.1 TetR/AcrR family transcriptional regulator [Halomicroarcula pellucida]GGN93307.1 transcriptional regulator [Halomicroarcula pellucida]
MTDALPFAGEPEDSHEAIMRATFCALQEHGYAGLSIQRIADKADLSKSTFYHHFDGKEDLLLSFLEFTLEEFDRVFQLESSGDPATDLQTFFGLLLGDFPTVDGMPEQEDILATYVELRAQAVRNPDFRAKFTETDQKFTDRIATLIEEGREDGAFRDVDAERTAQFLLTTLEGITLQNATRDDNPLPQMREAMESYIENELLVEDHTES